jgi:uncharacterized membrane protein YcaP (DUF421 family)
MTSDSLEELKQDEVEFFNQVAYALIEMGGRIANISEVI